MSVMLVVWRAALRQVAVDQRARFVHGVGDTGQCRVGDGELLGSPCRTVHTAQGGVHRVQTEQVAPDQPGGSSTAVTAQLHRPCAGLQRVQLRQGQRFGSGQPQQQFRLAAQGVDGEITGNGELAQIDLETSGGRPLRRVRRG